MNITISERRPGNMMRCAGRWMVKSLKLLVPLRWPSVFRSLQGLLSLAIGNLTI